MKLIIHESYDPYFNLACEEYYFGKNDSDYLILWRNNNTIVIGKNQNPYNEVNLDVARESKVTISRRMTGGGAVYHDMGNVNFTFIFTEPPQAGGICGAFDFRKFNEPIVDALAGFGVVAEIQGRNDIIIGGKKISGSAQFVSGDRILHHGTLLYCSDLDFIGSCLTSSGDKLKSKGVASVRSRVTNIAEFMDNPVPVEGFISALADSLVSGLVNCKKDVISNEDLAGINTLRGLKYSTWNWIYGTSPEYNFEAKKRFENCGSVGLYLNIKKGSIRDCRIYGDFFGNRDISDIERLFNGREARARVLHTMLAEIDWEGYIHNLTLEDFLSLLEDL